MGLDGLTYFVLLTLAVLGSICVMPYAFTMNRETLEKAPLSTRNLVIVSLIQATIMFAVVTFIGLLATEAAGLSVVSDTSSFPIAFVLGIVASVVLILLEHIVFRPYMPEALRKGEGQIALWKRFLASFYGGISEEILTRLFLMSGFVWLMKVPLGVSSDTVLPLAISGAAILFGIGHLPATMALTPLTPLIVVRAIVLNSIFGIVCGWLFWQYGLVAAMIAHFTGDIVLHVISPMIFRQSVELQSSSSVQTT